MAPRSQAPERGEDASASFTLPRVWPSVTAAPGASHDALERGASLGLSSLSSETGRQKDRPHGRNEPTCAHERITRGWHVALGVTVIIVVIVIVGFRPRARQRGLGPWERTAPCPVGDRRGGPPCQRPQRRDKPDPPARREFAFLSETARRPPWSLAAGRVPFPSRLWGGAAPTRVRGLLGRTLCWASARAHAG